MGWSAGTAPGGGAIVASDDKVRKEWYRNFYGTSNKYSEPYPRLRWRYVRQIKPAAHPPSHRISVNERQEGKGSASITYCMKLNSILLSEAVWGIFYVGRSKLLHTSVIGSSIGDYAE